MSQQFLSLACFKAVKLYSDLQNLYMHVLAPYFFKSPNKDGPNVHEMVIR